MTDTEAIEEIYHVLDGKEWSADTLEEIAMIVSSQGFVIRTPEELEEERERYRLYEKTQDERLR